MLGRSGHPFDGMALLDRLNCGDPLPLDHPRPPLAPPHHVHGPVSSFTLSPSGPYLPSSQNLLLAREPELGRGPRSVPTVRPTTPATTRGGFALPADPRHFCKQPGPPARTPGLRLMRLLGALPKGASHLNIATRLAARTMDAWSAPPTRAAITSVLIVRSPSMTFPTSRYVKARTKANSSMRPS